MPDFLLQNTLPKNLPLPEAEASSHSNRLQKKLIENISQHGPMPFEAYMKTCLYEPGLGYYSAGCEKLGTQGDFITAPMISPLFGYCIAAQCQQILADLTHPTILELGAGTGQLCVDVLTALEKCDALPDAYWILEVSADLRERQQQLLQQQLPHLYDRIKWLDQLPDTPFSGVILANEVLDAMPVQLLAFSQHDCFLKTVDIEAEQLVWRDTAIADPQTQGIAEQLRPYLGELHLDDTYLTEFNPMLPSFIGSLSDLLTQGAMLLIDYGYARHEYYHPSRHMGTLMCHYRHHAHTDPLILPGLQDLTAHVDFTAVAEAAVANQLSVAGYATQAAFLMSCGLLDVLTAAESRSNEQTQMAMRKAIQTLTHPHEMGELFKVIALSRGIEPPLMGFSLQNWQDRL